LKLTALVLAVAAFWCIPLLAQGRTDVVVLANGDRITGEIVRLDRGRLEFKTDDAGTLYLEWDKLVSVVSNRVVELVLVDGSTWLGSLGAAETRHLAIATSAGEHAVAMLDVTEITPIGRSFWKQLDGSIDLGYSYTRSSGVSQLNFNSDTIYRKPKFQARLAASATQTRTDDDSGHDDRGSIEVGYLRYRWPRWFVGAGGRFEANESLGLKLRSQLSAVVGPRLVNTNRAQLSLGAGLAANDEHGVDVDSTRNLEGLLIFRTSYYTYDRPKTNLDVGLQYYPSLSNIGRHRLQLDAGIKRELLKDFFASASLYNTYDSRPPNPASNTNDVGIVLSIGWSY
jgi:hypothetical protein